MSSVIRIYKHKIADICFVEVIESQYLDYITQHKSDPLFAVLDRSEKVYASELSLFELRTTLFEKVVKSYEDYRIDRSYPLYKNNEVCGKLYGTSFSFSNQVYEELNKEIKEKLGLRESA